MGEENLFSRFTESKNFIIFPFIFKIRQNHVELVIVWLSQGKEADRKVFEALAQSSLHILKSRSLTGLDWKC